VSRQQHQAMLSSVIAAKGKRQSGVMQPKVAYGKGCQGVCPGSRSGRLWTSKASTVRRVAASPFRSLTSTAPQGWSPRRLPWRPLASTRGRTFALGCALRLGRSAPIQHLHPGVGGCIATDDPVCARSCSALTRLARRRAGPGLLNWAQLRARSWENPPSLFTGSMAGSSASSSLEPRP